MHVVVIYTNTAFYFAADAALQGEVMSMRQAFAQAWKRKVRIIQWGLFSGVVGFGINLVGEKLGLFGKILSVLGSIAWSLAIVFAIPVMVRNDVGPVEVLKRSSSLFRKTWGENMTFGISIGSITVFIVMLLLVLPIIPLMFAFLSGAITVAALASIIAALVIVLFLLVSYLGTLQVIFNAALYRYAEYGDYVGPFNKEMVEHAFVPKKKFLSI
jgi:hypothetical protein